MSKIFTLPLQRQHIVFMVVMLGTFTTVFTATATLVAMPVIAVDFSADLLTAQWLVLANFLTISILLLPVGSLSDAIGRKKIFAMGALLFCLGGVATALSPTISLVIAGRILAAAGSAMMQACSLAIVANIFPKEMRGQVFGLQLTAVSLGSMLGPAFGGFLIAWFGWRKLYLFTGLIAILVFYLTLKYFRKLPPSSEQDRRPLDVLGSMLMGLFLVAVIVSLSFGPRLGWADPKIILALVLSLVLLVTFIKVEQRVAYPLVDFKIFKGRPTLLFSVIAGFMMFLGASSMRMLVPFFLFFTYGYGPQLVGLVLLPGAMFTAFCAPFVGKFSDSYGARKTANIGLVVACMAMLGLSFMTAQTRVWWIVLVMIMLAISMATFHAPNNSAVMSMVPKKDFGLFSGMLNLSRNMGNVVGIALATAIVAMVMAGNGFPPKIPGIDEVVEPAHIEAFAEGCRWVFRLMLVVSIANTVAMYFSKDSKPSS